jgi:UDP-3-O-[3-hydroxymyristoyl] glucosamine N-acyltransferase
MWNGFVRPRVDPVADLTEHDSGRLGFIKNAKFLDQLSDYQVSRTLLHRSSCFL